MTVTIRVVFPEAEGAFGATIDIPRQGATGVPLRAVTEDGWRLAARGERPTPASQRDTADSR